ncbi:MAG: ABC transporter permease [Lachnospiraceae bacterium]|nr:ABC transporter permease [Lachnospiraceae bacterium]MBR5677503.1 ABC transporter permease [Paludibacteraceae bacterium]
MKALVFAKRNFKELSRDVLGYIFCIAFPIVMLVVMSVVNESIPKEAGMKIFRIDNLAGGVLIFGQTFIMLFTAIQVTNDRSSSFLMRLFSSPMKGKDFTLGYILPMLLVSVIQSAVTFAAALIIADIVDYKLNIAGLALTVFTTLPSAMMFIAIGLIFGSLLNEKSAPGVCSVIVSGGTFLGGVFFDAEGVGGSICKVCKCLPFIYCTKAARASVNLDFGGSFDSFLLPMIVTVSSAFVMTALGVFVFSRQMRSDK